MTLDTLWIADYRAGLLYRSQPSNQRNEPTPVQQSRAVLAEHAGFLTLPAGTPGGFRAAFVDDASGELVLLRADAETRVSVAIPGEHLACSADGRYLAVSTGAGLSFSPWSDLVTVCDLARLNAQSSETPSQPSATARVRVRVGEPGIALTSDRRSGEDYLLLRHREPGAVEAISVAEIFAAGPHCPPLRGSINHALAGDGHGDAYDPETGTFFVATSAGLERFVVESGRPVALATIPWPVAGRAYYLRFCPEERSVLASLRGGEPDPSQWVSWQNWFFRWLIDEESAQALPLGNGLVFRFALSSGGPAQRSAALAVIHPDGDEFVLLTREKVLRLAAKIPLPSMSAAPRPGHPPWDPEPGLPAQRRAITASPQGELFAVSRGGDAEVQLVSSAGIQGTLQLDSPLDEGGHLCWLPAEAPSRTDLIGR